MPYSPELAARILAGATRKSLRPEFKFSQKLFQELSAGPLRALQFVDAQLPKFGIKSTRTPPPSMLLPSGIDTAMGRYTYRANIVIQHPIRGVVKIVGRFSDERLLTGTEIRQKMQSIGEKAVETGSTRGKDYLIQGRVRRIEILTTLVNEL